MPPGVTFVPFAANDEILDLYVERRSKGNNKIFETFIEIVERVSQFPR